MLKGILAKLQDFTAENHTEHGNEIQHGQDLRPEFDVDGNVATQDIFSKYLDETTGNSDEVPDFMEGIVNPHAEHK